MQDIKEKTTFGDWLLANLGRIAVTIIVPALTVLGLYWGFFFLRDSNAPQWLIALVAIIWGVGGVAAIYFVTNWFIELLPPNIMKRVQPFLFVGPAVALLALYLAYPALRTLWMSLQVRGQEGLTLANYEKVFTSRIMLEAFSNNLLWMIVGTVLTVSLGLLIAMLADRSRFENLAKSLIFMPMAISMVGAGVIFKFIYDVSPNIGMLNAIVTAFGGQAKGWLTLVQPWNNLFLIVVMIWSQTGYAMVLLSAAIKGVPEELLEAARVDGATEIRIFFSIIIPYISGTLITVVTTIIIYTLKVFDVVMAMTGGQFGTEVIGVRFYRELFTNRDAGAGSAIAIVLLIAVIPVMAYNLYDFSKREAF